MKVKSLIKYLQEYPEDASVSILITNPDKNMRKVYPVNQIALLAQDKDNDIPCILVGVGEAENLDEEDEPCD